MPLRLLLAVEGFALLIGSTDARQMCVSVVSFVSEVDYYFYRASNF